MPSTLVSPRSATGYAYAPDPPRSGQWVVRESAPAYSASPRDLAVRLADAVRELSLTESRIVRTEARWLAAAHRDHLHHEHGFASFSDWVRERLHLEPRTARRRVTLHHALDRSPALAVAFHDGSVSTCQALLLHDPPPAPADDSAEPESSMQAWIQVARRVPVRRLRELLRDARTHDADSPESTPDPTDTEPLRALSLRVPAPIGVLFDETVELARRRLGYQAPRHAAFDAMLTEAESTLLPPDRQTLSTPETQATPYRGTSSTPESNAAPCQEPSSTPESHATPHRQTLSTRAPADPDTTTRILPFPHPAAVARAADTLDIARRELADLHRTTEVLPADVGPRTARADRTVDHLRRLDSRRRPLRILRAGMLRALRDLRASEFAGYPSFAEYVESEFHLSERAARDLLDESDHFALDPHLAWAYESGRIGAGQLRLIRRHVIDANRNAWIARAETVTHAQLEREVRLLSRLTEVTAGVAPRGAADPFPDPHLEPALRRHTHRLGWTDSLLDTVLPGAPDPHSDYDPDSDPDSNPDSNPDPNPDPARDPRVLHRLDALLDILELEIHPDPRDDNSGSPELTATPDPATTSHQHASPPEHPATPDRQTLSTRPPDRRIALRLPAEVLAHWHDVAERLRTAHCPEDTTVRSHPAEPRVSGHTPADTRQCGTDTRPDTTEPATLSDAAVLTLVIHAARTEWLRLDPDARPREHAVLERDGWRCRAPGCTARRHLEVHHITFRSRGGPDTDDNKITLCHAHHRRGIHHHRARLTGHAPAQLHWRLGRPDSTHAVTYKGESLTPSPTP